MAGRWVAEVARAARFTSVAVQDNGAVGPAQPPAPGSARRRRALVPVLIAAVAGTLVIAGVVAVAVAGRPAAAGSLRPARPFTLSALGDPARHISLSGYADRPVILNFFASWCPPCKRETPLLASFYARHHGQVAVIGIDSNDPQAAAERFVRADRVGYPVAVDPLPAATALAYGVAELPQTFFLNARHQIVKHVVGGLTAAELRAWAQPTG
jgi:cytochrome c biogenesis protein CcmG/thiol:disulfide interchange protein DsbE